MVTPSESRTSRPGSNFRAGVLAIVTGLLGVVGCAADDFGPDDWAGDDGAEPIVVATYPADGQRDWSREGEVVFTFSEPVDVLPGEVIARAGVDETPIPFRPYWRDGERREVVAVPLVPLPAFAEVAVAAAGFRDLQGNPQTQPHVVRYRTIDDVSPRLVETVPREGAVVDLPFETVVFAFDESLDLSPAVATIEGEMAEIRRFHWSPDTTEVRLTLAHLLREERYTVRLEGIRDRRGNEAGPVSLSFRVGRDRTSPRVVDTSPREGAIVAPGTVDVVRVELDETMRAANDRAVVEVDGTLYPVWGHFDTGQRVFELPLPEAVQAPGVRRVSVRLAGLTDVAGNHLDPVPVVGDGRLDFFFE
ncbi:MAG TPA: Ig-like domain-containing protein [Polyangiaceae bacterium LLY-WYZ-14_1]|nr:Ig-like domain-containing protein [Polyangiaceae bacterium LLY-WYZ-14_1]